MSMIISAVDNLVRLLFPHLCVSCMEKSIDRDQLLCVQCLIDIPYTDHFTNQNNKVIEHFYGRIPIEYGAALLYFGKASKVQNMLHNFKYRGIKSEQNIGILLGRAIGRKLVESEYFNGVELMIPVPIYYKKREKRGFNQTELIANGILKEMEIEYSANVLVKLFDTETQTYKNRIDRMINVENTLGIRNKPLIQSKHILLVDDVITTGATLEASGKTLLENGASKISVVTAGAAVTSFL